MGNMSPKIVLNIYVSLNHFCKCWMYGPSHVYTDWKNRRKSKRLGHLSFDTVVPNIFMQWKGFWRNLYFEFKGQACFAIKWYFYIYLNFAFIRLFHKYMYNNNQYFSWQFLSAYFSSVWYERCYFIFPPSVENSTDTINIFVQPFP